MRRGVGGLLSAPLVLRAGRILDRTDSQDDQRDADNRPAEHNPPAARHQQVDNGYQPDDEGPLLSGVLLVSLAAAAPPVETQTGPTLTPNLMPPTYLSGWTAAMGPARPGVDPTAVRGRRSAAQCRYGPSQDPFRTRVA